MLKAVTQKLHRKLRQKRHLAMVLAVVFAFALGHSWLHMAGSGHDAGLPGEQNVSASCVLAKIAADDLPALPLVAALSLTETSFVIPDDCAVGRSIVTASARAPPLT